MKVPIRVCAKGHSYCYVARTNPTMRLDWAYLSPFIITEIIGFRIVIEATYV